MALYAGERDCFFVRDNDGSVEADDLDSEFSDHGNLPVELYNFQRQQNVYFSNQEYYRRLEELKCSHLRNMAALERMYISEGRERPGQEDDGGLRRGEDTWARQSASGPMRKLQRINSQEELEFHETSSGSDQSEPYGADSMAELELDADQDRTFGRDVPLGPGETSQKQFRFPSKASSRHQRRQLSPQSGVRVRTSSKVTVPRPFQMMLREEERKKHKVRTRSEVELENTLLRRELEELQECQKKFRASPAPAHIHLPLYEVISCRSGQQSSRGRSHRNNAGTKRNQTTGSPQPFHFLERERRKREAKIVAELGKLGQKEERRAFKARPMPSSVYGTRLKADAETSSRQPRFLAACTLEREATEGHSDPNSDPEPEVELSIKTGKGRERSRADPPTATACSIDSNLQPGFSGLLLSNKGDYISV